jgi:hypothetical protein
MPREHFTFHKQTQTVDFTSSRYTGRGKEKGTDAKKEGVS